ncbi:MAG: hypothetical protein LBU67_00890, partial [Oscillospiraceae bacterium]|nr:hypothetical protein [Oscillospiraceae bacterium]
MLIKDKQSSPSHANQKTPFTPERGRMRAPWHSHGNKKRQPTIRPGAARATPFAQKADYRIILSPRTWNISSIAENDTLGEKNFSLNQV